MIEILLTTLLLCISINLFFFLIAFVLQTDAFTDFSYGLSFMVVVLYMAFSGERDAALASSQLLVVGMVGLWAVRLTSYLVVRIRAIKRDKRFDTFRHDLAGFLRFWILQGISVWVIMIPSSLFLAFPLSNLLQLSFFANRGISSHLELTGVLLWFVGLSIETIADWQKYNFKNKNKNHWADIGLWKYARHPNYFGEMLVWWGIWLTVSRVVFWYWPWGILSLLGPLFITGLLLFVSGIPLLEKQQQKKYGKLPAYRKYLKNSNLLVPIPKFF